jgi:hypothetical protein
MADDPVFAAELRNDPVSALRGIDLSAAELRRIERVLDAVHGDTALRTPNLPPRIKEQRT